MIKTAYAYLFFFFYTSVNKVKGNILVQWKSILMVLMLEIAFLGSIYFYTIDILKTDLPDKGYYFIFFSITALLIVIKLLFFERNEKWRLYITEFEKWPIEKRKKWNWIMRLIIMFVIGNLVMSIYIMSQIDWSYYR